MEDGLISFIAMDLEEKLRKSKKLSADRRDQIFDLKQDLKDANELACVRKKEIERLERLVWKQNEKIDRLLGRSIG